MNREREIMTRNSIEQLEILEAVIRNPYKKIGDILNNDTESFNANYTEIIILLTQFLMNKDNTITKDVISKENVKFKNWILEKYIEEYANTGCSINIFISKLNDIRNCIGHGDYFISKNNPKYTILKNNKSINNIWLKEIINNLFVDNKNKLKKLPIKTGYLIKKDGCLLNINDVDSYLDGFDMFEYNIKSDNTEFNTYGLNFVQTLIKKYKDNSKTGLFNKELWLKEMNNAKEVADVSLLNFEYETKSLSKIDDKLKSRLKFVINNNIKQLENATQEALEVFIKGFMNDFYFDSNDTMQIDKAFSQISLLANVINDNKDYSYNELKNKTNLFPPTDNQMLLAIVLIKFNSLFSYNDDKLLSEYFDFSKLDLSKIRPFVCTDSYEYKYLTEKNTIFKLEKENSKMFKQIQKIDKKVNKSSMMSKEIKDLNIKIYSNLFDLIEAKYEYSKKVNCKNINIANEDMYIRNKAIIHHIRNAISHGNIKINSRIKNNDLSSCILTFTDYNAHNKTFELTVSLDKIYELCNCSQIFNILYNNEEDVIANSDKSR